MAPIPWASVTQHRARGIVSGCAGHAAARMRARSAQVQPLQRHSIIGGADHRARAEQLIEPHLAMENVAADEAEAAFEIERRMDLATDDRLSEARCMVIDGRDDRVGGLFALLVPAAAAAEIESEMLAEQRRDVLALGREAGIQR